MQNRFVATAHRFYHSQCKNEHQDVGWPDADFTS